MNLFSQTITLNGKIFSSTDNSPIENANIFVEKTNFGSTSNSSGEFQLFFDIKDISNEITIIVDHIGFESTKINYNVNDNRNLDDVFLNPSVIQIEEVNVLSEKDDFELEIKANELTEKLSTDLATTLSYLPNINVLSFGQNATKPVIRGYSGNRFFISKNGNEFGDLSSTALDHAITLDLLQIDAIELIRGPKTLIYGPNTVGGVINTTVDYIPNPQEKPAVRLYSGSESYNNSYFGMIKIDLPYKNNQISIGGNSRNTGNQTTPLGELINTSSNNTIFDFGITNFTKKGFRNFIFEKINMNYGIPPTQSGHIYGVDIKLFSNYYQFHLHEEINFLNFNDFHIKYLFIDYAHEEFENDAPYYDVRLAQKTHNFEVELKSNQTIVGTEFNYKKLMPDGFVWTPLTNRYNFSMYGFNEKKLKSFDLLTSIRSDFLNIIPNPQMNRYSNLDINEIKNRSYFFISYSLGIRKKIDNFTIKSFLINSNRGPSIEELYSDGPHLGIYSYEIGKPNLNKESTLGFETSIEYESENFNINVNPFYNFSNNYFQMDKTGKCNEEFILGYSHPCAGADFIEWGSGSGWLYKYQIDEKNAEIKGVEVNLKMKFKSIDLSYDFSNVIGNNLDQNIPLSYMNPTKQIFSTNFSLKNSNLKIRLIKLDDQNRLGEFETFTPSSMITDLIFTKKINACKCDCCKGDLTIKVNNLFNQLSYNHLSRTKDIMPEPGRNLVMLYNFDI
tara:strand:- start:2202 stop:4394 length:2193 start_codon:yes stop_codon:yes gene_type:complete